MIQPPEAIKAAGIEQPIPFTEERVETSAPILENISDIYDEHIATQVAIPHAYEELSAQPGEQAQADSGVEFAPALGDEIGFDIIETPPPPKHITGPLSGLTGIATSFEQGLEEAPGQGQVETEVTEGVLSTAPAVIPEPSRAEYVPEQAAPTEAAHVAEAGPAIAPVPASAELAPEVVDEIVRRVVAQISETVVREIAWEIVPDCVERIVDTLTRENLNKKT